MAVLAGDWSSARYTEATTPPGTPSVSDASSLLRGLSLASVRLAAFWNPLDAIRNGSAPGFGHCSDVALVSGVSELEHAARAKSGSKARMPRVSPNYPLIDRSGAGRQIGRATV